jgi:hypothetical protein
MALTGIVCLLAIFAPFLPAIRADLPLWAQLCLGIFVAFLLIKVLFGRRVMEKVLANFLNRILDTPLRLLMKIFGLRGRE